MLIFLDFDGVLHPFPLEARDNRRFAQLPVFETFFRQPEQQDCRFIISSTWRRHYSLAQLRSFFSADFHHRIIGTTPHSETNAAGMREQEILYWLQQNGGLQQAWLALDDMPEFFRHHQQRVFFTHPDSGLRQEDYPALSQQIAASRDTTAA